jgi:hypothetical protein
MPKPDIHQLEKRVLNLMREFRVLKRDNESLSRRVEQLNLEKKTLIEERQLNLGSQNQLSQLEHLNQKNEKDRKVMRAKVQTLIDSLEKFDLA